MRTISIIIVLMLSVTSFSQSFEKPFVAVSGESILSIMPDYALIKVRVETTATTAVETKKKHDISVDAVLKFLKKHKIDSKDVATQYLNLKKSYDYNTKTYQFNANQSIFITLRDFKQYEKLLQGLFENGITALDEVQFATTELEKHQTQARKLAVLNAKQKATEYAATLNQTVGKALVISEFQHLNLPHFEAKSMLVDAAVINYRETIAINEIQVKAQVTITFELH